MLAEGFSAMWHSGWRGKLGAVALLVLVALASVMGTWSEWRHRKAEPVNRN